MIEHDATASEFPDDWLLLFVDETGTEKLSDPRVPYFGFGGCACRVANYQDAIVTPWDRIERGFGSATKPLHAADLSLAEVSAEQIATLGAFFEQGKFWRLASIAKAGFVNETGAETFHVVAVSFLRLFVDITKVAGRGVGGVVVMIEHSQRLDRLYGDYFRRYPLARSDGSEVPMFFATQRKSTGGDFMHGLRVADFIAHAAGNMSRATKGGTVQRSRKDFEAVFQNPNARHFFIDAVRAGGKA